MVEGLLEGGFCGEEGGGTGDDAEIEGGFDSHQHESFQKNV